MQEDAAMDVEGYAIAGRENEIGWFSASLEVRAERYGKIVLREGSFRIVCEGGRREIYLATEDQYTSRLTGHIQSRIYAPGRAP